MGKVKATLENRVGLYNNNKLKLGLFAANCSSGRAATKVPERWIGSWEDNLELARMADDAGIDFLLPIGRWKGYRGETNFHGAVLEPTIWATGLLAHTKRISVFSTIHAPLFHPVVTAKQFATADLISQGRLGMNVVCGWNQDEFDMFGVENREHDLRYAYGREWLQVIRRLWESEREFDFDGKYIRLKSLISNPKPYGGTRPVIMNAGASPAGRDFAIEQSDVLFSLLISKEQGIKAVAEARTKAAARSRNDIKIFTSGYYVCRPTRTEAEDYHHYVVEQNGDFEAYQHLLELQFPNPEARKSHSAEVLRTRQIGGNGSFPIIGSPDDVAEELKMISDIGFDGLAASFVNYTAEFPFFRDEVLPRLKKRGLRV
jgi:alkanesulfonate monooxygenase SsuD/methylene tetrahydromethanopterin reductase-like flavin-dependent oxidoreductase (luciferase family)